MLAVAIFTVTYVSWFIVRRRPTSQHCRTGWGVWGIFMITHVFIVRGVRNILMRSRAHARVYIIIVITAIIYSNNYVNGDSVVCI